MKTTFGVAIAILAVVASAVVGFVAPTAAGAAPQSACTTTTGVTVIVDFTHFSGGKIERGCAPGHPANGLIALHAAGFTTAGTAQYGDAFVCRIDNLPSPKQDACAVTPSPSAFWAYWNAKPSDSAWTYSALGVLDFHPKPGTIEAFAFGNHAQPGVAPAAAIPPTTTTTSAVPPPTRPQPPVTAATLPPATSPMVTTGPLVATTTDAAVVALGSTTTTIKPAKPKPTTTTTRATTRSAASTSTTVGIVERSASGPLPHNNSGSPFGAILAIVIVGGLAAGAFAFTRARRSRPA